MKNLRDRRLEIWPKAEPGQSWISRSQSRSGCDGLTWELKDVLHERKAVLNGDHLPVWAQPQNTPGTVGDSQIAGSQPTSLMAEIRTESGRKQAFNKYPLNSCVEVLNEYFQFSPLCIQFNPLWGLPGWLRWQRICLQCRRPVCDP